MSSTGLLAPVTAYTLLAFAAILVSLSVVMLYPSRALRWMQRKRYQYEVTFSLYMMTPTEKFIFNSILFLFLSMVTIAASLYLPEHIAVVARRGYYYALGDGLEAHGSSPSSAAAAVKNENGVSSVQSVVSAAATSLSRVVGEGVAAVSSTASATRSGSNGEL